MLPTGADAYSVRGSLSATVVQTDVVTLEPVSQEVSESIDLTLLPAEDAAAERPERRSRSLCSTCRRTAMSTGVEKSISVRIVVEHLALGLDPYPRSPGVEFPGHEEGAPDEKISPFAALAKLKREGE